MAFEAIVVTAEIVLVGSVVGREQLGGVSRLETVEGEAQASADERNEEHQEHGVRALALLEDAALGRDLRLLSSKIEPGEVLVILIQLSLQPALRIGFTLLSCGTRLSVLCPRYLIKSLWVIDACRHFSNKLL